VIVINILSFKDKVIRLLRFVIITEISNIWHGRTPLTRDPFVSLRIPAVWHGKGKGKAVSLQAWSGPEGSRKLRFQDFLTTAQDDGKVVSLTHRPLLPPGNIPSTHFC
jgi:hypothetical protein